MGDRLRLRAHAKVNLCLSVGAPIADGPQRGMHPIASWFAPIEVHDEVTIERINYYSAPDPNGSSPDWDIRWAGGDPVAWPLESDLAYRAAQLVKGDLPHLIGFRVRIRKRIPAGGGLGGGSSDAAAVMVGLNHLYDAGLSTDELRRRAATLGSDIAYFIDEVPVGTPPRPAYVGGLGDEIVRTPAVAGDLTLFCPRFGCPTGAVYAAFDAALDGASPTSPPRADAVRAAAEAARLDDAALFNDLAGPACDVQPDLNQIRLEASAAIGRPVHVSGSGSTLFALGHHRPGTPFDPGTLPEGRRFPPGFDARRYQTRFV